jgi:hypothetical protein
MLVATYTRVLFWERTWRCTAVTVHRLCIFKSEMLMLLQLTGAELTVEWRKLRSEPSTFLKGKIILRNWQLSNSEGLRSMKFGVCANCSCRVQILFGKPDIRIEFYPIFLSTMTSSLHRVCYCNKNASYSELLYFKHKCRYISVR